MNEQTGISLISLKMAKFAELRESASPEALKESGQLLREVSKLLGFKSGAALARAMGVSSACISRWMLGSRRMRSKFYKQLANLAGTQEVDQSVVEKIFDTTTDESDASHLEIPITGTLEVRGYISCETLLEIAAIADILETAGSTMTLQQVIECLFKKTVS